MSRTLEAIDKELLAIQLARMEEINANEAHFKRLEETNKSYANLLGKLADALKDTKVELKGELTGLVERLEYLRKSHASLQSELAAMIDRVENLEQKNKAQIEVNKQLLPLSRFSIWDFFKRK